MRTKKEKNELKCWNEWNLKIKKIPKKIKTTKAKKKTGNLKKQKQKILRMSKKTFLMPKKLFKKMHTSKNFTRPEKF